MKVTVILTIVILSSMLNQSFAQKWIKETDYLQNNNNTNGDSMVVHLRNEMMKEIGKKHPYMIFKELDNIQPLTLEGFRGHTVVVNFWDEDCGACRAQLPQLSELQKEFEKNGLKVIYISRKDIQAQKEFFKLYQIDGIKAKIEAGDVMILQRPYQFLASPTSFIIDASGIVRDVWIGPKNFDELKKLVLPYIMKLP